MSRLSLLVFLILWLHQVAAQEAKRYSFTHYGSNDGIASNEVVNVVQDEQGYIWIATTNGLQRFDGVRFQTFRHKRADSTTIPSNYVVQLMFDSKKNLWLQAGDKFGIFDTKKFRFTESPFKPTQQIWGTYPKWLQMDGFGNLFIAISNHELLSYNPAKNEFSSAYNFIKYPDKWDFLSLFHQPGTRKYWIGTHQGISVYNAETGNLSYAGHNTEREDLIEKLGTIRSAANFKLDSRNRLWFDTWKEGIPQIFCYDFKNKAVFLKEFNLLSMVGRYHELGQIFEQKNGTIWIKGLGVFAEFQENSKQFRPVFNGYENEQSIAYNRVSDLFEDREGNIWVATSDNALYRFNPQEQFFRNTRHINRRTGKPGDGSMMSFVKTKFNTILAGAWGDGLYHFDTNYNMLPLNIHGLNEKATPSMWSMFASRDGNTIWIGSQPGIYKINQDNRTATFYSPPIMQNRTVRQIVEDKFGNLWMGTQSIGLFKWTATMGAKNFNEGVSRYSGVPETLITKIFVDGSGYVWVATASMGMYVIDPKTDKIVWHFGTNEPADRKLSTDAISTGIYYDDSTVIIGASGIQVFNTRQQKIVKQIPLPEIFAGRIASLERDNQGYLWLGATSGLFRINITNNIFIHFDRVDGIVNDYFILSASYVMPDGRMLFGTDNQFISFNPADIRINDIAPAVQITGFNIKNRSLPVDSLLKKDRIELRPDDNSIVIEFSGLSYIAAYLIKYKLEGLDEDWKIADKNFKAIYSYLPPGTYTFLARSEDAEGVPSKHITRIVIHINPPFWKTWWFFCILALLVAAIFYWLDKQRVNKLIALQSVRTDIASNLHQEVNTTLNNINLLSEMARIKADKDVTRSKEYIDQISTKSHNMIIAMDDILWSIDPMNDSMEKSLLRMMEFADALKNRHGARIEIALDKKVRSLKPDMKTRHELFIIFKEALRLIVQYSGGKETVIHIDLFKNKLSMKLQDPTASLDNNLEVIDQTIKDMHTRAAQIKAELDIQFDKNGIAIILLLGVQ